MRWVYYETNLFGDPELSIQNPPLLKIDNIHGGFGIKATIQNTGNQAFTNINWSIKLDGNAFIVWPRNRIKTGTIPTLEPGEEVTIKTGLIIGLGKTDIIVAADELETTTPGFILLCFVTMSR
jgi:hypothetical protein